MANNEYLDLIGGPVETKRAVASAPVDNEYLSFVPDNVIALPRAQAGALAKPEPAGQAVQLGQSMGFPSSVIGADLANYQQIDKGQKAAAAIEKNRWISGYVARNPEAAEVSNDDYEKLDNLSKKVKRFSITGREGGMINAIPEFILQTLPEAYNLLFTTEGRAKATKNAPKVMEALIDPFIAASDFAKQGFDITDPADMDRAQALGLLIGLGKITPKVGKASAAKGEIGPQTISSAADIDRFLIDALLAKGQDPKTVLQIEHAKADSAAFDTAVAAAAETATKTRAPTLLDDFVKGHETGTLTVPAQAIVDLYRAEGKMPAQGDGLFGFVSGLPQKLQMGMETGAEVDVPVSTYLAHIDPAVHEKLKENIRFSNDGMTLAEAKEADPKAIEAFHGSPHTFDAFSMEKIGTGEGAQSYGHGLYFAENAKVAGEYQNMETMVQGQILDHDNPLHEAVHKKANYADPIASLKEDIARGDNPAVKQKAIEILQSGQPLPSIEGGNLYKVAISANREHFLDWDKPLNQQVQHVQDALRGVLKKEIDWTQPASDFIRDLGYGQQSSDILAAAGIPGIKYLDQGSRPATGADKYEIQFSKGKYHIFDEFGGHAGEFDTLAEAKEAAKPTKQTSNFVVFDPKSIIILERNGQALRTAAQAEETELGLRPLFMESKALEKVAVAATEVLGKLYTGVLHPDALETASKDIGVPVDELIDSMSGERVGTKKYGIKEGFITTKGRFVSREEAAILANKADQIETKFGGSGDSLSSEMLKGDDTIDYDKAMDTADKINKDKELGIKGVFAEPPPGMSKTDFERYNKKIMQINQKTLDKATEVQTREAAKRRGEEWKANEAALRPEVEAQVRAFPDIAADRFLRSGELPGGTTAPKVRLDEDYVNALLVKNEIPALMLEKSGVHPDDIAPFFGFNSGAEMVRSLNDLSTARRETKQSPTQHLNELVKRELDAQMESRYGNLEAAIADEARALALDELHFDILADEMRALAAEAGGATPLSKDGIKAMAQEYFAKLDAKSGADFAKFQKTAGRNGLLAERALLAGDPVEAFNAKQRQAINFLFAKEAQKFGKLVDRTAKKIDRVTKNDSIASMDQGHFDQLKRVLGELGFDTRGSDPRPAESLGDFVRNSDGQLAVAAWLTDGTILPRDPSALTVQQMQELAKSIDSMMHVGRQVKTLDSARGRAELQNVIVDVKAELSRFDFVANPLNSAGIRPGEVWRKISAWSLLVERMLDYSDKFDPNGPLTTYLDRPLREGNNKEIILNEKVTRQLRKLSELTDNSINDVIPNDVIPSTRNESGFLDMNRRNLRQLMGYMGSDSGIAKVVNGWRVDEADVWKLINDNATKADWQWVAGMHKMLNELWPEAADMIERDTGVRPEPIQPRVMKSEKFGDFPGGYWRIHHDKIDSNIQGHIAGKGSLFDKGYVYAATPHAYTMPRTEWWGALDLSGQLITSDIRGMIHDIAFREPVRNAAKLINNQEFMTAMTQAWGKEYAGLLTGWIKDIANSSRVDDSYSIGIARISSLVRQNITSTLVGFNPSTVIKHGGTALGMSATAVGEKSFLQAAWDFGFQGMLGAARDLVKGQKENEITPAFLDAMKAVNDPTAYGDGVRQFILDSSAVMRNRQRKSMENIRDQMNKNLYAGTSLSGVTQGFMDFRGASMDWVRVPVAMSDAVSAFPTWLAAYKEAMRQSGDHTQAVFEADKQVSRAHGSQFIGDKPMILRTSEPMRWFTPLYNFYNHFLNMLMNYVWDAKAKFGGREEPGATTGSLSKRALWLGLMPIIFEELALPPLTKDERGGIGIHMAMTLMRHFGATIPGVRDFTNAWTAGFDPAVGFLGTFYKTISQTISDASRSVQAGKNVSENWLSHAMTAIGFATGIGSAQIGKTGSYVKDRITGRERTPRTWDELRQGLRTGHSKPRIIR